MLVRVCYLGISNGYAWEIIPVTPVATVWHHSRLPTHIIGGRADTRCLRHSCRHVRSRRSADWVRRHDAACVVVDRKNPLQEPDGRVRAVRQCRGLRLAIISRNDDDIILGRASVRRPVVDGFPERQSLLPSPSPTNPCRARSIAEERRLFVHHSSW